jgi:hypothetical protein
VESATDHLALLADRLSPVVRNSSAGTVVDERDQQAAITFVELDLYARRQGRDGDPEFVDPACR